MFARQGLRFSAAQTVPIKTCFWPSRFSLSCWVSLSESQPKKKNTQHNIRVSLQNAHTHFGIICTVRVCLCAPSFVSAAAELPSRVLACSILICVYSHIICISSSFDLLYVFFFFFIPFSLLFHRFLLPFTRCSVQCSQFSLSSVLMCIGAFFVDFFVCFGIRQNKVWTREEEKYILSFFLRLPQFRLWCSACVSSYFDILE